MKTRNIAGVECLRVILCIGIIMFHTSIPGSELFWIGIEGFWVLSAFFLVKSIYEKGNEPVKLVYKRIKRLYFPYSLLIIWATIWAVNQGKGTIRIVEDAVSHFIFMQNFAWMKEGYVTALCHMTMHTWTMSIEICLYIFMIIVLKVIKKDKWKKLFISIIVVVALCRMGLLIAGMENVITFFPLMHLDAYAIGSLSAVVYIEDSKKQSQYGAWFRRMGILAMLGCLLITMLMKRCGLYTAYTIYASSEGYLSNVIMVQIYLYAAMMWGGYCCGF